MKFDVAELKALLEKESEAIEAEVETRHRAWEREVEKSRAEWLIKHRELVRANAKRLLVLMDAKNATEETTEEYRKLNRSLPDWYTPYEVRREKPRGSNLPEELRRLKEVLNVVTDEEVSVNMLEKLGFTRDSMRVVVRLLNREKSKSKSKSESESNSEPDTT